MADLEFKNRYYELGGMWFSKDTDKDFAEFIVKAYANKSRIEVTYNPGWADFSGYHGGNGLKHSFTVGKSTGRCPVPLVIVNRRSIGGSQLLSCSQSIKSYRVK